MSLGKQFCNGLQIENLEAASSILLITFSYACTPFISTSNVIIFYLLLHFILNSWMSNGLGSYHLDRLSPIIKHF